MTYRYGLGKNPSGMGQVVEAAAAAPQAVKIVSQALNALIGIVDPGKKRDAYREQRAEIYYQLANAGSVTAARILHGGSLLQYTDKEKQYYIDRWAKLASAHQDIASQALALEQAAGQPMGVPEPGSNAPPAIASNLLAQYQQEINTYHATQGTPVPGYTVPVTQGPISAQQAGIAAVTGSKLTLLAIVGVGLFLAMPRRGRGS